MASRRPHTRVWETMANDPHGFVVGRALDAQRVALRVIWQASAGRCGAETSFAVDFPIVATYGVLWLLVAAAVLSLLPRQKGLSSVVAAAVIVVVWQAARGMDPCNPPYATLYPGPSAFGGFLIGSIGKKGGGRELCGMCVRGGRGMGYR